LSTCHTISKTISSNRRVRSLMNSPRPTRSGRPRTLPGTRSV
jgi:hypothetical protein